MFDLSITKIAVLLVIAVVIFGPEQLPRIAAQAGRGLRDLRRLAEGAKRDLTENLGPEFQDFELNDLHPANFVRKHLLDEDFDMDDLNPRKFVRKHLFDEPAAKPNGSWPDADTPVAVLPPGETPPFDFEAT